MRLRSLILVIPALLLVLTACSTAPKAVDPRTLAFAPLQFSIPKSDQVTLKNGMRVYLLEDHELPIVNMTAFISAGSIYDPPELTSLAGLTGSLLRSGGTESLPRMPLMPNWSSWHHRSSRVFTRTWGRSP